jgi:hypothetical protein
MRKLCGFILAVILLAAADGGTAQAAPFKVNSGKTLEVLAIKPEKAAAGPALVLHYATSVPLADHKGLRREADELWEHFSQNADAANVTRAVVRATDPKGREKPVDFVFVKRGGIWHTVEKGLEGGKLTEQFIRDAHDHQQWIHKHKNNVATVLYLGNDWTVTYTYPPEMRVGRQTFDRKMMLTLLEQARNKITERNTKIEITDVRISSDGKSATVSSRLSGETEINGQIMNMNGEGQDFVVVRDGTVVSIRSVVTIEKFSVAIEQ